MGLGMAACEQHIKGDASRNADAETFKGWGENALPHLPFRLQMLSKSMKCEGQGFWDAAGLVSLRKGNEILHLCW